MNEVEFDFRVESLFDEDYKDAQAYHRRALQFRNQGQAYSLVFNIASVALERYLVAMCELYGVEPMNHNFITLMMTVDKLVPVPKDLSREIKSLDKIFGICFLDDYYHGTPMPKDAERALCMCDDIKDLFDGEKISSVQMSLKN